MRFAEELQHASSEDQARLLLARHLEAVAPDTMVTVTGDANQSSAAQPIVAGGVQVGTALVRSSRELPPRVEQTVHDSILRAAPVLGNLRSLAIAQTRAATDPLTGLGNRRLVEDALTRMVAQAHRTGDQFAVVMIDVDRFKSVNDMYGHEAGDTLLVAVAEVLTASTREYDIVGRRGGDEFIMLLAQVDEAQATQIIERCRAAIDGLRPGYPALAATASFGIAISAPGHDDAPALVRAADAAVYAAKARGGNCVVAAARV